MSKKNTEPDIHEIRKQQCNQALSLAKTIDASCFFGTKNDVFYYLVTKQKSMKDQIQTLLGEHRIDTEAEYRDMSKDYAIYLKDDPETLPKPPEESTEDK